MDNNYHPKKWLPEIALQSTQCNYYQLLQCITYWHFFYQLGQKCKLFQFLLSLNSQRRLEYKENNTNREVCPKSIGAMLEYWYIICVLFTSSEHTVYMANALYIYVICAVTALILVQAIPFFEEIICFPRFLHYWWCYWLALCLHK